MSTHSLSMNRARRLALPLLAVAAASLAGCTTYYKVTDATTQRAYYTTKVDDSKLTSGAVRFTDAATGAEVTLQSSEVQKISKQQYDTAVKKN